MLDNTLPINCRPRVLNGMQRVRLLDKLFRGAATWLMEPQAILGTKTAQRTVGTTPVAGQSPRGIAGGQWCPMLPGGW